MSITLPGPYSSPVVPYHSAISRYSYGQFCCTTTQSGSANTAYSMPFNVIDFQSGINIISGSRITVSQDGFYNLQFSAQLAQTTNGAADISIWIAKNGTDEPASNTMLSIEKATGGGKLVAAWNYGMQLNSGQYVELKWSSTSTHTHLAYIGTQTSPTRPSTPSVIATLIQIA